MTVLPPKPMRKFRTEIIFFFSGMLIFYHLANYYAFFKYRAFAFNFWDILVISLHEKFVEANLGIIRGRGGDLICKPR